MNERTDINIEVEGELPRFPIPTNPNSTLTRTDINIAKQRWTNIKNNLIIKGENESKLVNLVKRAQNTTKTFLGVDTDRKISRSVNNWNERQFKLLGKNALLGGLKNDRLAQYIDNIQDNIDPDTASPLLYYQISNGQIIDTGSKRNVGYIAMNSFKRMLPNQGENNSQLKSGADEIDVGEANSEGPWDACTKAFSGQRMFGVGFCGRFFDNDIDPDKEKDYNELLKSIKSHRPYFTYWITMVQILICLVSILTYGLAPFGFSYSLRKGFATTTNLEKRFITYPVKQNFWIGPEPMDLIHLGAKYAPCMRNDSTIYQAIKKDMDIEKETACCIRNDRGGCVQTNELKCSNLLSKWHKWNTADFKAPIYKDKPRTSGSVCGLDPEFCVDSKHKEWADDITQWPICNTPTALINITSTNDYKHMYCEVIGRPCCIGIQGECLITTLEHCDLLRGYFHADANLCSQVDCMQDVCGMIDFLNTKSPDQVYRLFTSIFINAGLLQLLVSIFFNIFILRDLEKLAGSLRIGIIYVGSGVIGNLGSAIFLPYQAEVGPFGSHFGILACQFIEMFHAWDFYKNPWLAFVKVFSTLIFFFIFGLLPMIDNFANLFGFVSGLFLASILFPNVDLKGHVKRTIVICVSITVTVLLVSGLVVSFYLKPIDKCEACKFFSCPFGSKYCLEMDFDITRLKNL